MHTIALRVDLTAKYRTSCVRAIGCRCDKGSLGTVQNSSSAERIPLRLTGVVTASVAKEIVSSGNSLGC